MIKHILRYKHFPIITASLALVLLCALSFSYGSRPAKKRALTNAPMLWAKLDGALTDEVSTGDSFAYSPGKPSTESGVSIKEGDNIQYSPGNAIDAGSSIYENWNPNQGTMNVWVQSNWAGNDNTRHDIWNGDYGRIDTADSNLKAYFKFDEGSEDFAFDSTANGNVGYLHGPVLSFDGGDYVNIADSDSLDVDTFSIEAWVKAITFSGQDVVLSKWVSVGNYSYFLDFNSGKPRILLSSDGTATAVNKEASSSISTGVWHYVVAIYNSSAQTIDLYAEGSLVSSSIISGSIPTSLYHGINNVRISRTAADGSAFDGQINNVRIYSRALSETEVGQHYVGNYADESGLVGYWPMDENQGQYVYDKSGNNNNGTRGVDANAGSDDPTWVKYAPSWTDEGRFGKGVVFDGGDDEVEMGDVNF